MMMLASSSTMTWSAFFTLSLLVNINYAVAQEQQEERQQQQQPPASMWDIPVSKADPPPPTGSIWDIPIPKPAPVPVLTSPAIDDNDHDVPKPAPVPALPSPLSDGDGDDDQDKKPLPCPCTFDDDESNNECAVYGLSASGLQDDPLVPWRRASNECIQELNMPSDKGGDEVAAYASEATHLCPADNDKSNKIDATAFATFVRENPSSPTAVKVKQLFLGTGIFVEAESGVIEMADKMPMVLGPAVFDCQTVPMFCWQEIEHVFENNAHVLHVFCDNVQDRRVAPLIEEQQNVRVELCRRGGGDAATSATESENVIPVACHALWEQIQQEQVSFPDATCLDLGEGPGDVELPSCSSSNTTSGTNDKQGEASSTPSVPQDGPQPDPTDPEVNLPFVPDSNATAAEEDKRENETAVVEFCPCSLDGADEQGDCRVHGLSPSGQQNEIKAWHRANFACLRELDSVRRPVNPSRLRQLCRGGGNDTDPFDFVEFVRQRPKNKLTALISQIISDKELLVSKPRRAIALPDMITLSNGHVLDCIRAPMFCWNEVEYQFRLSSDLLQGFCVELLEREMTSLHKEQQEARVRLCTSDTPAPEACKLLSAQIEEEKIAFPDAECMAFAQSVSDVDLPKCGISSQGDSETQDDEPQSVPSPVPSPTTAPSAAESKAPSSVAIETIVPSASPFLTPDEPSDDDIECPCSFHSPDESNCRVYGLSPSGTKGNLTAWHHASDDCLYELGAVVRSVDPFELQQLCPNESDHAHPINFVDFLIASPGNRLAENVKRLFLDKGLFAETANRTIVLADTISLFDGHVLDCNIAPMFCWKQVENEFRESTDTLKGFCVDMHTEQTVNLQKEQQSARVLLCTMENHTPNECNSLWQQVQEEKANFPNASCTSFGAGPGDLPLPTCDDDTSLVPSSGETADEGKCPCFFDDRDEDNCRVYGSSASGDEDDLIPWHQASDDCLYELTGKIRPENTSELNHLCPYRKDNINPVAFAEMARDNPDGQLAYRIKRLFLEQGLFVEAANGTIALPSTMTPDVGHILDCNVAPMHCWEQVEAEFLNNSHILEDFCDEMLAEHLASRQNEQQEARILLCTRDVPPPMECQQLWEQVEDEKSYFPNATCAAFGKGPGNTQLPKCEEQKKDSSSSSSSSSSDSHSSESSTYTLVPSSDAPSMAPTPYVTSVGECACNFEQDDEASCRVYGLSVSGEKNELTAWHPASDVCLEEIVRFEVDRLCPSGTPNVTEFAHLVFAEAPNELSDLTMQRFLNTSFFVENDNGTVAVAETITLASGTTKNCTVSPMFCWNEIKFKFEQQRTRLEELCGEMRALQPTIDSKTGQEWARVMLCESNVSFAAEECAPLLDQIKSEQELHPAVQCSAFGKGAGETRLPVCEPSAPSSAVSENYTAVRFTGIAMVLDGVGILDDSATAQWEATTASFYEWVHGVSGGRRELRTSGIRDFSTMITYQAQNVMGRSNTLVFDTQVNYVRASPDSPTSWELIKDPLKDETMNQEYVESLRASHSAFANLVRVGVPFIPPPSVANRGGSANGDNEDDGGVRAGAIIGFLVFALCALAVCYAAYRHLRNTRKGSNLSLAENDGDRIVHEEKYASSNGETHSHDREDDNFSSTSEILDSILKDEARASERTPTSTPRVVPAPSMSEDSEGTDLECQMYAQRTIPPSTTTCTENAVSKDEQSSLPSVICTGPAKETPQKTASNRTKQKSYLKIDCCDYDHVFGDDATDNEYIALSRQASIVRDTDPLSINNVDDPEACGYEGDIENPSSETQAVNREGSSSTGSSSSCTSNDCSKDRDMQQSSLSVSPSKTFVSLNDAPDLSSRTLGRAGSSVTHSKGGATTSENPSDASSGTYYDDGDVVVVVKDAGQGAIPIKTNHVGSGEETASSASNSSGDHDRPVDEEVIEVEAPPGWLGVVIDTSDPAGPPIVYDIKNTSPMRNLLELGDKIIAVDDEDVTHTSAPDVSRLINKRVANPIRRIRIRREIFAKE